MEHSSYVWFYLNRVFSAWLYWILVDSVVLIMVQRACWFTRLKHLVKMKFYISPDCLCFWSIVTQQSRFESLTKPQKVLLGATEVLFQADMYIFYWEFNCNVTKCLLFMFSLHFLSVAFSLTFRSCTVCQPIVSFWYFI